MDLSLRSDEFQMSEPPVTHGLLDVVRLVWRRRGLVLLSFAIALLLGGGYYVLRPRLYQSEAQLLVMVKGPQPVLGKENGLAYPDQSLSAHQALIQSPLIIGRAIEHANLAELRSLRHSNGVLTTITESLANLADVRPQRDPKDVLTTITENLTVVPITRGRPSERDSVLGLTYRSTDPRDCPRVLSAVIESYRDYLAIMHRRDSEKAGELLDHWRDDIERQLAEKRAEYRRLREQSTELFSNDGSGRPVGWDRLDMVESKRFDQKLRREEISNQLAALEEARRGGVPPQMLVEIASNWSGKTATSGDMLRQWVALLLEEQDLAQSYGPRHPKMAALRKRIEVLRGQLPSGVRDFEPADLAEHYMEALRQELRVAASLEESLDALAEEERADAKQISEHLTDLDVIERDMENLNELHRELIVQTQGLNLYKDSGVIDARLIAPPLAGEKIAPSGLRVGAVAGLLGLLLAGTFSCIGELADRRILDPFEVHRRLGVSVVGQIPQFHRRALIRARRRVQDQSLDPTLCTFYQANSNDAEAFRSLRTTLYFRDRVFRPQVIQVTSARHGDGKSTLAANLAVSIAQSGKRTLLVDADFRSSCIHQVFNMQNQTGLASVLGQGPLDDAIQATSVANLCVMPTGLLPSNAADLLAMPRFTEMLHLLRERFDFVLLDTAPVLGVSDPCVIAPQVDGVLLTVRAAQDWPTVKRAKQILDSLGANVLGVVINGVGYSGVDFGPFPFGDYGPASNHSFAVPAQLPGPQTRTS